MYKPKRAKFISLLRARKLAKQGCLSYLAHIWDVDAKCPSIKSIHVVYKLKEVLTIDLSGMIWIGI